MLAAAISVPARTRRAGRPSPPGGPGPPRCPNPRQGHQEPPPTSSWLLIPPRKRTNMSYTASSLAKTSGWSISMVVRRTAAGWRWRKLPSYSSASATNSSPPPDRAEAPQAGNQRPDFHRRVGRRRRGGGRGGRWPSICRGCRRRPPRADLAPPSARRGAPATARPDPRARQPARAGPLEASAALTATRSIPPRWPASWPVRTVIPAPASGGCIRRTCGIAAIHTRSGVSGKQGRACGPAPAMPMTWMRSPAATISRR